jgi:hypothetical protein
VASPDRTNLNASIQKPFKVICCESQTKRKRRVEKQTRAWKRRSVEKQVRKITLQMTQLNSINYFGRPKVKSKESDSVIAGSKKVVMK